MIGKLLGGALLLLGTLMFGRHASAALLLQPKELRSWIDAMELLQSDISAMVPLPEALLHAGRVGGCAGLFLERLVLRIKCENRMLSEIWEEEVRSLPFSERERDCLLMLGSLLGKYDAASQCRALERCAQDFQSFEKEARDKARAEAGLRLRLIGAAGALLLIVLW